MYTRYFGLTETPFAISPNPRYLYMSELHREALAHLLYGISNDGCMVLLTGDIGTGKTTLCRCLLEQLPEKTDIAIILNPRMTARDLLKTICEEFGILPAQPLASIKTYIDTINQFLLDAHARGRTIALIIDEAQNLDLNVLEQVRLLTNLETNTKKLLRILLIGQPELKDMLERPELIQVNQRITSRYHLSPLQPSDVRKYIQHRLQVAGDSTATLFTEKAIQHAIKLTGGIPRLINVLCDRALLGAYAVNADHVNLEIMKRAGAEVFPKKPSQLSFRAKTVVLGAVFLACLAIPALVFLPVKEDQPVIPEQSATKPQDSSSPELPALPPLQEGTALQDSKTESSVETAEITPAPTAPEIHAVHAENSITASSHEETISPQMPKESTVQPAERHEDTLVHAEQKNTPSTIESLVPEPAVNAPIAEKAVNTIRISAPLLVLKKAGPIPQKSVEELIGR